MRLVVDNRAFLIALDAFYREAMMRHEKDELLDCAREVAAALGVTPYQGPIEGYYVETASLSDYFRLARALQHTDADRTSEVNELEAFQRLYKATSSPIYGRPLTQGLLPAGTDPLTHALGRIDPGEWNVERLTSAARDTALEWDDISLVGLAAWLGDAVVLTALRESVVLYAEAYETAARDRTRQPPPPTFVWDVDPELVVRANRFIDAFNAFSSVPLDRLPERDVPEEVTVIYYWKSEWADIVGRCARLALDPTAVPIRHYHWAIYRDVDSNLVVDEFWSDEIWTSQRYGNTRSHGVDESMRRYKGRMDEPGS